MGKGKVSILLRKMTQWLSGFRLYLYICTYILCGMIYTAPEYILKYSISKKNNYRIQANLSFKMMSILLLKGSQDKGRTEEKTKWSITK